MKKWGIIGALLFAGAVVFGYFTSFDAAVIIEIAVAAFGLCAVIVSAVKGAREKNIPVWQTVVMIVLASVGGVICCIGGLTQTIFAEISGAALALLSVIFGLLFSKKE
ncbi:MAG: hypothetical protein J6S91_03295 [Treponema sp.]|nr:hypothetical protein [Treponema sp.]MBR7080837.1 hypothetical protein [Treponema sp.]